MSGSWEALDAILVRLLDERRPQAWDDLMSALYPLAMPELRKVWRRLQPGVSAEDLEDVGRDLLLRVHERLQRDDFAALRRADRARLRSYLITVFTRLAIDHQRTHPLFQRQSRAQAPVIGERGWRVIEERISGAFGQRPPLTRQQDALRMLEFLDQAAERARAQVESATEGLSGRARGAAARAAQQALAQELKVEDWAVACHLAEKGGLYRRALELELSDQSQREIAEQLAVSRREVEKVLEYATRILRARFAEA
jgi:DNA-directed RNA polymerase specialized sigma24 family protein